MQKPHGRMKRGKDREETPVRSRGKWYPGVPQDDGKQGSESNPQYQHGGQHGCPGTINPLHKTAHYKIGFYSLLPGYYRYDTNVHAQVQDGNPENRNENTQRDVPAGVPDFTAEVANIVISQVAVDGFYRGLTQQQGKSDTGERIVRSRQTGIGHLAVGETADYDPLDDRNDPCPQQN